MAFNGINQTLAGLNTAAGATGTYRIIGNNTTLSTLTINNAVANTFAGIIGSTGTNNNNFALPKRGAGILTLSNVSTYTGATTINAGTLAISGSINNSTSVSVGNTGALALSNIAAAVLADVGTLSMTTGSPLNLNANSGTSEVIFALVLDGVSEPVHTCTAAQLAALDPDITSTSLSGETLTTAPVPEPATWATGTLLVEAAGWRFRRRTIRRAA